MKQQDIAWKTKDGIDIFGKIWSPDNPKAVICLVHGFGEHISRYDYVAKMYNDSNYAVIGMDHRGHGKSKGQRGHTPDYNHLLDDIAILLEQASNHFPNKKQIIHAHSMGGNIVTNFLLKRKSSIAGAVVTAPFYRTTTPPPAFQMWLGKKMINIWPAFPDRAKLDASTISKDKAVVEKYKKDPMVHNKISAMMGMSLIREGEWAIQNANLVKQPLLLLHGDEDQLTDYNGTLEFFNNSNDYVSLKKCHGMFHEVHNEPDKAVVMTEIINWCNQLV